uniref:RNase H type-1 domain-containing protein n=1 Tax=Cajanus cajan TaxID=3821 RepID=A0A151RM79_CAJCA|nr:hypothetical protein KK1_034887 [Cajanus cajan]
MHVSNVVCISDSLHALNLIQHPPLVWHVYATIIARIRDFTREDWRLEFKHTLREGNSCANFLAKREAAVDEDLIILEAPLAKLSMLLDADIMRVPQKRL